MPKLRPLNPALLVTLLLAAIRPAAAADLDTGLTEAERREMSRRLEALEQRIDFVEATSGENWLTDRRAGEIRSLVSDVIADADTRASLLGDFGKAGYKKRIFFESADGTFRMEVSGRLQIRWAYSHQNDSPDDDDRSGFELRRAKIKFGGHVVDPRLRFAVTIAYDEDPRTFDFQGASIQYKLDDDTTIKIGRFRTSLLREEDISSRRQLAAERSLASKAFTQNRTLGLGYFHEEKAWRVEAGLMSEFNDARGDNWLVGLRVEWLLEGKWKLARDFTSFPGDDPLVIIGGGVLYREEDPGSVSANGFDILRWTADVGLEFGGSNLFASVIGNHRSEPTQPHRNQLAVVVQGGAFINDDVELFARYEWGDADGQAPDLSVLTVGFNRYFEEHGLKFTTDIGYGFNEVAGFWDSGGANWRRDRPGEDGQIVVRSQMQLQF